MEMDENIKNSYHLHFSIRGELITRLAREKVFYENPPRIGYAIELLMSCLESDQMSEGDRLLLAIKILNGEAKIVGTYPEDDYGVEILEKPEGKLNLIERIDRMGQEIEDLKAERRKLSDKLACVAEELDLPAWKMRAINNALESFRTNRTFRDEYDYYESVLMTEFIRDIQLGVKLYRDRLNGIAWAEDHRTGLGISVHPNIDETGSVDGMVNLGYWRKDDRVAKSHGWIYNIDRLTYDSNDPIEAIVASECRCAACLERRR